jgi:hypothetical protein
LQREKSSVDVVIIVIYLQLAIILILLVAFFSSDAGDEILVGLSLGRLDALGGVSVQQLKPHLAAHKHAAKARWLTPLKALRTNYLRPKEREGGTRKRERKKGPLLPLLHSPGVFFGPDFGRAFQ